MEIDREARKITLQGGNELEAAIYALEAYRVHHDSPRAREIALTAAELDFSTQDPKELYLSGDDADILMAAAKGFASTQHTGFTRERTRAAIEMINATKTSPDNT